VAALAKEIKTAIFYPDVRHTVDPKRLVKAPAEDLAQGGAALRRARALGFEIGSNGVNAVVTDAGALAADLVAVAAGAWSKPLAGALGCAVPLDTERGHHVTLPEPGIEPRVPVVSSELRFCATPMAMGLRLGGTVEFAGLDAPPDPTRYQAMLQQAKRLYPALNTRGASYWMGHRPSLPDSLPVIGRAPGHANAYLAFGHGHIGLTTAAITGRAIADKVAGRAPPFDLAPFRADRF
jgi:D-amino-acid dehydrogenase